MQRFKIYFLVNVIVFSGFLMFNSYLPKTLLPMIIIKFMLCTLFQTGHEINFIVVMLLIV